MLRRTCFLFKNKHLIGLNGGEILKQKLIEYKTSYVFGYSGGCNLSILNSFYKSEYPKFINTCTEQGAGFMAIGYSKSSYQPGVAITTSGPGMTNIITNLYDAYTDHIPLIVFSGQVSINQIGTNAFQEAPACNLAKSVTKWSYQVRDINEFADIIDKAYEITLSGKPGPVFIDLPKDVMIKTMTCEKQIITEHKIKTKKYIPDNELLEASELINKSKNPIIFVGQGAKKCYKLVRYLALKNGIPVTSTLHGLGIFNETHPQSLKMVGMHGSAAANYAMMRADLIIGIGARFDDRTTGNPESYARCAYNAHQINQGGIININIEQLKTIKPHFNYGYDAQQFLSLLLSKIKINQRTEWNQVISHLKQTHAFPYCKESDNLKVQDVLIQLNNYLETKKINYKIATGVGNHQQFTTMYIRFTKPNQIITSGSSGTMGVCLPFLIGCYYADKIKIKNKNKNKNILIGVDGDGSFNMSYTELQHVAQYNIPIKLFIMNDKKLQMVATWQSLFYNNQMIATDSYNPDYKKICEAWNIRYVKITTEQDLNSALKLLTLNVPIIFDCHVKPTYCLPLVAPGKALDDMILYQEQLKTQNFDQINTPG